MSMKYAQKYTVPIANKRQWTEDVYSRERKEEDEVTTNLYIKFHLNAISIYYIIYAYIHENIIKHMLRVLFGIKVSHHTFHTTFQR